MLSLEPAPGLAPTLVLAVGNASRGDDALGPLAAERIEALRLPGVEVLVDFQLQVEHALDLLGRSRVLFIDAHAALDAPFALAPLVPQPDRAGASHALAPAAVLDVHRTLIGAPPPSWLLAIRGQSFELGEGLSETAAVHLEQALRAVCDWIDSTAGTPQPAAAGCHVGRP